MMILAVFGGLGVILAAPVQETGEVRKSMHDTFENSRRLFAGAVEKNADIVNTVEPNPNKPKVFSLYTKGLTAVGGGKPHLASQYLKHNYTPLAPVVVPVEKKPQVSDKMSPSEAAERFKPEAPFQYTTDRMFQ